MSGRGDICLPGGVVWGNVNLPAKSASKGSGHRAPRDRRKAERHISTVLRCKGSWVGAGERGAFSEAKRQGSGTRVRVRRDGQPERQRKVFGLEAGWAIALWGERFRTASVLQGITLEHLTPFPFRASLFSRGLVGQVMGTSPARSDPCSGRDAGSETDPGAHRKSHGKRAPPGFGSVRLAGMRAPRLRMRGGGRRAASDRPPVSWRTVRRGTAP